MSTLGIDVSSYNGTIDWAKVKAAGMKFAILKVIRKDLSKDKKFDENWNGATAANLTIQGVYNYSYATTAAKAKTDAMAVLDALNGKKCMVWLDVEDSCQKKLGKALIAIINAYASVIKGAGLEFGVYTGLSFYNTYIKPYGGVDYPMWIARYGSNGDNVNTAYQPQVDGMIGWQYTSKGSVSGIKGYVDKNVWYKELGGSTGNTAAYDNPYEEPTRVLYKKTPCQKGNDVKWLQYALIHHNCLSKLNSKGKTNIDGILGNDTANAIGKFQEKAGIKMDKKCGAVTRKYLKL